MLLVLPLILALWAPQEGRNLVAAFVDAAVQGISDSLPNVMAVVTLLIALMTFKVSKESKLVAEQSRRVAEASHRISETSLEVAINDWKQVGREEPWSLIKLDKDYWLLERLHYDPAAIIGTDVSPHCGGSEVLFQNSAGFPTTPLRRGGKIVLQIPASNPGASFSLYYREFGEAEPVPARNELFFAGPPWSDDGIAAREGSKEWTTPLY